MRIEKNDPYSAKLPFYQIDEWEVDLQTDLDDFIEQEEFAELNTLNMEVVFISPYLVLILCLGRRSRR